MNELLVTAAVLSLIGAAVGGGLKLMGNELPLVGSVMRQALLGLLGVSFLVLGLFVIDQENGGGVDPPPTTQSIVATTARDVGTTTSVTPTGPTTTVRPGACVVTIANALATLRERPERFSQEIMKIPPGVYTVARLQTVAFGPQNERWMMIQVGTRSGWIPDETFTIASKSAGCP